VFGEEAVKRVIEQAMQMEIDGRKFYLETAERTRDPLGKMMFESIAHDEEIHFETLSKVAKEKNLRAASLIRPSRPARDRFESLSKTVRLSSREGVHGDPGDLEALDFAMQVERKGYRLYKNAAGAVDDPEAKKLCEWLAFEENEHFKILRNTYDYLSKPIDYFTWTEGSMLDGGP